MKKFLKSLSVVCLALVLIFPLALVGCDRNYTINIEIVQGQEGGFVYLKDVPGVSAVGDSTVSEGEKFEYFVSPSNGYQIAKVMVDGKVITDYDKTGAYLSFEKVKRNHNVKVYFETKKCTINFYCIGQGNSFELFKSVEIEKGSSINLNQASYGGERALWYYKDGNQNIYFFNGLTTETDTVPEGYEDSNILFVHGDGNVYCNKTESQLINDYGVIK